MYLIFLPRSQQARFEGSINFDFVSMEKGGGFVLAKNWEHVFQITCCVITERRPKNMITNSFIRQTIVWDLVAF